MSVDLPEKSEVELELRLLAKKVAWPEGYFQQTSGTFATSPFKRPSQGIDASPGTTGDEVSPSILADSQ